MKLEELARRSSDAARASVAHLDPPPIGSRSTLRTRLPLAVGVAALIAVVGLGAMFVLGDDPDDSGQGVTAAGIDVPRLGLAPDSGYVLDRAFALPMSGATVGNSGSGSATYYGRAGDDPYANDDLLIGVIPTTDDGTGLSSDGVPVTVRGRPGTITSDATAAPADQPNVVSWTEPGVGGDPPASIMVASHSRSPEDLLAIAEGLTIRTDPAAPGADLADDMGLQVVATRERLFDFVDLAGTGSLLAYTADSPDRGNEPVELSLSVVAGSFEEATTALRWWANDTATADVAGKPATVLTIDFNDGSDDNTASATTVVLWAPTPGTVANLVGTGPIAETLIALASNVVPIDDETWNAALRSPGEPDPVTDNFDEVYVQGEGSLDVDGRSVGYSWALGRQDGALCFELASGSGSSGSCQADDASPAGAQPVTRAGAVIIDTASNEGIASVVMAAAPDVDKIVQAGPSPTGTLTVSDGLFDGVRWYVWVGPTADVAFDVTMANGDVIRLDQPIDRPIDGTVGESSGSEEVAPPMAGPSDVASNPSAQALGIADDFIELADGFDDSLRWSFGTSGGQECFVTEGGATMAACLSGDISVLKPVAVTGGERTFVIVRRLPECVRFVGIDAVSTSGSGSATADGETISVIGAVGTAMGWSLLVVDDADMEIPIDLPDVEGSISWPTGLCPR